MNSYHRSYFSPVRTCSDNKQGFYQLQNRCSLVSIFPFDIYIWEQPKYLTSQTVHILLEKVKDPMTQASIWGEAIWADGGRTVVLL